MAAVVLHNDHGTEQSPQGKGDALSNSHFLDKSSCQRIVIDFHCEQRNREKGKSILISLNGLDLQRMLFP